MLRYDPVPWLLKQQGVAALRARGLLGFSLPEDKQAIAAIINQFQEEQSPNGSFDNSLFKTTGIINTLVDLNAPEAQTIIENASGYLFHILEAQTGYTAAVDITPGSLTTACDLGGMFGPYSARNQQQRIEDGAREMNYLREFDPLLGPQSPVRGEQRSSYDRVGPSSCYAWGLVPLSLIIETLCRAGYAHDARLQPAINVLLGAQRNSGGWCRNLGGHPTCSTYALRAITAHPTLRESEACTRVINLLRGKVKGTRSYVVLAALSRTNQQPAHDLILDLLEALIPKQHSHGSFGSKHRVESTTAVLLAGRAIGWQSHTQ